MDATPQPPAARSSVLRSATLASVTLLLDAKNLCKLVGCSEEPGLEPTAAEDSPGRESGLAENNHPGEPPEDSNGEGHSGAEGSASDPAVIPGEGKDGLSAAGGRKEEQGDGSGQLATGVNGASGEERVDSWRLTASCQGGAALAVRLVERLLVEAVAPEWRGAQEGPPAPDGSDGIQSRTACGPVVSDDGQIWTVKTPDGSGRSGVPVLSRGQFIELLCVHCVLTSFLRRAESESRKKAEIEEMGRSSSKSSSSSDIGFGLPSLLGVLDCIERSCHTPSSARLAQLTPSAQLAVLHALSLARGFVEKDLSGSARASEVQGPTLRDLSGLVRRAVGLFKNSCLSALELAEIHAPTAELELEPLEDGGLLQSMPAALALARALETDSADLAAVAGGRSEEGPTEARLEEAEGAPRTREALDRWGGVKGVGFGRSSLQLAALTTLSVAFEWLERHSLSSKSQVESKKRRGDGEREDGRGSQSGTQRDALASEKQGPRSTAELDALVAGCVSPDEGAAVFLVARELVGEDSVMEELGLEGPPNPLGQLLVYVAVILRLEMEAGLETSLLAAFCRILTSLVRLYSGNHSPDRPLDLATGVARGLVAGFDVPAGAPLQFLVALVLDHSPLEVAVSWAASAVSECLETTTGLIEDRNETGLEAEKGSAKLGSDGPWKGAAERGMKGEKDGQLLVRGVTKRGVSPPQKSPDCEEAMRSWVENGGLKTEVPQLEDETGAVRESSASAPPVVRFATDGCRDQVLDLALRYLIRTVGRGAGADKDDGGETGEGHVAEDERGHVELGLEPLTQIIVAFTAVCDADVAVESKEELTEPGATRLLDERQSLRILRGVRAALGPVEEAVLWLSDLCGSAVLGAGKTDEADGLEETALGLSKLHGGEEPALGGSDVSANDLPAAGSLASERGLNGVPFDGVETAGDRSVSESREGIPSKDFANDEPAATVGPNIAYESGEGAGPPDASQVAAAAELVRLGARLHRAAEKLVGRKRGQWAGVVENEELQATLVRFRHQLEGLLAAYEACRDARKSTGLLDCLNVLCEDLGQAGFRVPDSGRLTTDVRTDFPVTDAYESGREEATNWTGADGLEVGSKEAPKPSGNGSLGASEKGPDAAEENLDAKARGLDAVEGGSDAEEGGSDASHVVSDREESEEPAESAHRTRSGRKSAAPSAWWAVVDQEKDKQERVAKRKASESVRKRESASEKRPKVAAATEMALVEQGGELAEIDLEEEERRNDRRSKRRRKMLAVKRRKAAARGPSGNKFVAYALEEQMLDSESEWDSDEYSDMEDFIALENEEVDFKTMPLSTITPYVPYEEPEEEAPVLPEVLGPARTAETGAG